MTGLAKSFQVEVSSLDKDRWAAAFTMAKALDTIVDDEHKYETAGYCERLLAGEQIPYITHEEAVFVCTTYNDMNNESQGRWRDSASKLGTFALKRIEAETVTEYIDVVRSESTIMTNVLLMENTAERVDHEERLAFNEWLPVLTRGIYAFDTFTDIIKDHNESNVTIEVTPRVVYKLGHYVLQEAAEFTRATPISVYPIFFRSIALKVGEKAKQPATWMGHFAWKRTRQY